MKKFLLIALLGLSACVAQTESHPEDETDEQESSGDSSWRYYDDGGDEPGCDPYPQVVYLPNGETIVVMIPALCVPFYIDKGDPPPNEASEDEVINPDPNSIDPMDMERVNVVR